MKESNTLADNATIKQHQKEILLNTKGQYMKESSTLAANATIKQHQKDILLDTKGQYMKESSTLVWIVTSNSLPKQISQGIKEIYIKVIKVQLNKKFVRKIDKKYHKNKLWGFDFLMSFPGPTKN